MSIFFFVETQSLEYVKVVKNMRFSEVGKSEFIPMLPRFS